MAGNAIDFQTEITNINIAIKFNANIKFIKKLLLLFCNNSVSNDPKKM